MNSDHDNCDELQALLERAIPRRRQYLRRTSDLEQKVLALARLGIPLATIASAIGIPAPTISSWSKRDTAFRKSLAEAVAAGRKLNSDVAMARSAAGERHLRSLLPRRKAA